jgi:hypothetical protein
MAEVFDVNAEYRKRLLQIDQDGSITIDTKILVEYDNGNGGIYWREEMQTHHFSFNETEMIRESMATIQVKLIRNEDGSSLMLSWPWSSVINVTHRTNSDKVAAEIDAMAQELQEKDYADRGISYLENALNHHGPHGLGCGCPPDDEVGHDHQHQQYGPGGEPDPERVIEVYEGQANPCNPEHHRAVKSDAGIWTCLECAGQWNDEGEVA